MIEGMLRPKSIQKLGFLITLAMMISSCARTDAYRKDHEFYEDDGEGYYSESAQDRQTPADRLEKLKQPRKRVLILDFWNDTPIQDETLGSFAAAELKRELVLGKQVLLPDEKGVHSVTKDFVNGEHVQVTQLIREGRRLGVQSIVVGRISKLIFRLDREQVGILREAESAAAVDVEMKVFDVASGREVHNAKETGTAETTSRIVFDDGASGSKEARSQVAKDAMKGAVKKLIPEVVIALQKMDWQGRIAKILGNKVYINAGRKSGLLAGDILRVLSPGEEIVDPVSQAYLGRAEGKLKGTLEVTEFIGEDSAMSLIHTGGNFQEGDVVRLY